MVKIPVKILIVDDEKDFVEMFSLRLTRQGKRYLPPTQDKRPLTCLKTPT
jgi:hypothetical protein